MSPLFLLLILFKSFLVASANEAVPKYSWQTFHSDQGYELKIPSCWFPRIDDPDDKGAVTEVKHVAFYEDSTCVRPQHDETPNRIGIGTETKFKTSDSRAAEIDQFEGYMKRRFAEKENLFLKRYKIGSGEVISYVRYMDSKNRIQWRTRLFCPSRAFDIMILTLKNPDQQYFDKFKKGDFGLPEPEKTILDSIKCVSPK